MKNLIIVLFGCCLLLNANAQARKFPKALGYISDFEGIFTSRERKSLDSLVTAFEKETTAEIAVVTLTRQFAPPEKFDSTVTVLHNEWGVGKEGKNNGILIAICKEYHKLRISNGYGIEAKMTDKETKQIIDTIMTPAFRQGKFYEGTRNGILAIMKEIR